MSSVLFRLTAVSAALVTAGVMARVGSREVAVAAPAAGAAASVDFDRDVRPILAGHCYECHGTDKAKGGLRLTERDSATGRAKSGKVAIVPGRVEESELVRRVTTAEADDRMPPEKAALSPAQVDVLRRWIAGGAGYRRHWAYEPVRRPGSPAVRDGGWARGEIDRFVLGRLEGAGVRPSPEAGAAALVKRLSYDLLGLPAELSDVEAIARDWSPGAWEALVDRLLASPHFGERWGRHWLDKARYADSDGYEKDSPRPDAWRYRDWVIRAVNEDVPFDRFTVEQLAGDLLPGATDSQRLATAFHRQTLTNKEGGVDPEQFRVEAVFDRVETTGAVWLGLTVGCARCHSHKYDTISQKEYYQLFAFFNNADEAEAAVALPAEQAKAQEAEEARQKEAIAKLQSRAAELRKQKKGAEAEAVEKQVTALRKKAPANAGARVRVMAERTAPRQTRVFARGDFLQPGDAVAPGVLGVLHPFAARAKGGPADRLGLANWLMDPANPLTARVAANDVWAHLFGKGLVRTPNDFGVRGERPSHPELLDYLAWRYRELGWSRKRLIREIVTSAAYRQSSAHRPELTDVDPENRLLARQNRVRVEGEVVRDLALAVAGLLSKKVGGPSVFPPMPADVAALSYANNFKYVTSTGEDRYRRGLYTFFKRTAPHPNLVAFDCPDSNATCVERTTSNTALQALALLNNESFHEAAQGLARRVLAAESAAWVATARVLLNLDEFVTRE